MKTSVLSNNAPKPAPFFSQAILTDSKYHLTLSGQIGLVPETFKLISDDVEEQTQQALDNIKNVLAELNWTMNNITKVRIYLTDMADYPAMNKVYAETFKGKATPARIAIAVKSLPLNAKVEIECEAAGDNIKSK